VAGDLRSFHPSVDKMRADHIFAIQTMSEDE
jgi:hypothetical protein